MKKMIEELEVNILCVTRYYGDRVRPSWHQNISGSATLIIKEKGNSEKPIFMGYEMYSRVKLDDIILLFRREVINITSIRGGLDGTCVTVCSDTEAFYTDIPIEKATSLIIREKAKEAIRCNWR